MRFADLHLHTFHSDGVRSPREVVDLAVDNHLEIIAISDHDNIAAYDEVFDYAAERSILLVSATELSAEYRGIDIHLLAYAFDPGNPRFNEALETFRGTRELRGQRMVERLRDLGYAITQERVDEIRDGGALGRPHVARVLVEIGAVASIDEAFDTLLSPGRPAFVPKKRFSVHEAIDLTHEAGGFLSVAHPSLYPNHRLVAPEVVEKGVDAIEVFHPQMSPDDIDFYRSLAKHHGCFITGGSDDHGFENRRTIGTIRLPEDEIAPILERVERRA